MNDAFRFTYRGYSPSARVLYNQGFANCLSRSLLLHQGKWTPTFDSMRSDWIHKNKRLAYYFADLGNVMRKVYNDVMSSAQWDAVRVAQEKKLCDRKEYRVFTVDVAYTIARTVVDTIGDA